MFIMRRLVDVVRPRLGLRYLTQSQTSTALRPFYFAVHPDLFTQHPRERLVNEESLKILNNHVESLLNDKLPLPRKRLPFYIRVADEQSSMKNNQSCVRLVKVPLEGNDLKLAVSVILRACDLSTDYVDALRPSTPAPRPHTVHGGIPNPEVVQPKPPLYLSTWMRKNVDRARRLHLAGAPVLEQTERMRTKLCRKYGLTDIRWASKWGVNNFHACLRRLQATLHDHSDQPWLQALHGYTLVLGGVSGVTAQGEVMLSSEDVPQDWLNVLSSVRRYDQLLSQLPDLEGEISTILNGISVVRDGSQSPVMADRYHRDLTRLLQTLQSDSQGYLTGPLSHLQLCVERASGPLMVSSRGEIVIPSGCPALIVRNFIQQTKLTAARATREYLRCKREEEMVMEECQHVLNLHALTKDDQISHAQMCQSCMRIMDDVRQVGVAVNGLRLKISQFYSVMNSGELVIPWNWNSHD